MKHPQSSLAKRRVGLTKITGEAQETDRLRGKEMTQRMIPIRLGTAQEMRQALFTVQITQPVGEVDPVPRLLDRVAGQTSLELTFENAPGVIGADFRQCPHVNDEMRSSS